VNAAPSKGWATLALICGLATLAVFASFSLTASPTYVGGELSESVSAFQRAVEPEQVTSLFADNRMARLEAMNAINKLDLSYFIAAYTLFVISAAAWLAGSLRAPWAIIAAMAALVGAAGDVIETRAQIGLVDAWIAAGAPHFLPEAAAEFSFFLAMPTMTAAFIYDFLEVKDHITSDRVAEIAIGFVFAFISAALVVKPFLNYVTRIGFAPFAWYRIALGGLMLAAIGLGYL
jgi:hypothetical protein